MAAKIPETQPAPRFPESSFKYNPLMHVRVLLVNFAKGLFGAAPEGSYRWLADDENTEIYITDEEVIQPEVVERMPAISFTRGTVQFYNLGLDDLEGYDFDLARKTKGVLLPGTMTANCCSRTPLESEQIAFVLADHIWLLRDMLMGSYKFFEIGRGIQVGAPSAAGSIIANDGGEEVICTAVSIPFQFSRLSSFTPLGMEIIQNIEQTIGVRGQRVVRSCGAPVQTHEAPVGLCYERPESFAPDARDVPRAQENLQPHPLNPSQLVHVRVVRGNCAATRLRQSRAAIPIPQPCVEQSSVPGTAIEQKG